MRATCRVGRLPTAVLGQREIQQILWSSDGVRCKEGRHLGQRVDSVGLLLSNNILVRSALNDFRHSCQETRDLNKRLLVLAVSISNPEPEKKVCERKFPKWAYKE